MNLNSDLANYAQSTFIVPEVPEENRPFLPPEIPESPSFQPFRPQHLRDARLKENDILSLILKFLYVRRYRTGRQIASQLRLPFGIVDPLLGELRQRMLVTYRGSAVGGDYEYELLPTGTEQAAKAYQGCTYCGSAPVHIDQYIESVYAQSLKCLKPGLQSMKTALHGMILDEALVSRVGQAVRSGKSILIYGPPGNGKTSVARRLIDAVGGAIWIPRAITVNGEIIRVFDASVHREVISPPREEGVLLDEIDHRWVQIHRPSIVVGGELDMKQLEPTVNPATGIIEAPVHVKSNGGILVVDDFGRQKISSVDLLNRWIIPLESGHDYLRLPTGRQIQIPFEQLLAFSTNLEPEDICDEAFLRRIKYKIEFPNPTREQFCQLWHQTVAELGFADSEEALQVLLSEHYESQSLPFRFCHVRDLLGHVKDYCEFQCMPLTLTAETIRIAANNYFTTGDHS